MKKLIVYPAIILFAVIALTGCNKEGRTFDALFFAKFAGSDGPLTLFIDGQRKGDLPFFSGRATCDNDTLKQIALTVPLRNGKYKIEAKDENGVVRSAGTITIKVTATRSRTSVSGGVGGQEVLVSDECVFVGLWE